MTDKLTMYYSVENCGDGSAYPRWFDTKELAEWHQDHLGEDCWGEPCTGEIVAEGDNLRCPELQTKEGYYLDILFEERWPEEDTDPFVLEFFPNGLPEFTVEIIEKRYYGIFVEGQLVYKKFAYPEKNTTDEGVKKLIKTINH